MKIIFKLFISILLNFALSSNAKRISNITCQYSTFGYSDWSNTTCCFVEQILNIEEENTQILIIGDVHSDCQGFSATFKEISYFPDGIASFIPNLIILKISNSKLLEVTSENLESFRNLEYLDLSCNKLQLLSKNLFQFNKKLRHIKLGDNQISIVDPTAFNGLDNIKKLEFNKNQCYSDSSIKNPGNIINQIKTNCWPAEMNALKIYSEHIERSITRKMIKLIDNLEVKIQQNQEISESLSQPGQMSMPSQNSEMSNVFILFNTISLIVVFVILIYFKYDSNRSSNKPQNRNDEQSANSSTQSCSEYTCIYDNKDGYEKVAYLKYNENIYDEVSNSTSVEISHDTYSSAFDAVSNQDLKNVAV